MHIHVYTYIHTLLPSSYTVLKFEIIKDSLDPPKNTSCNLFFP